MINGYATEFRHAWRAIANRPAFSALVVAVLAVGLACVVYVASIVKDEHEADEIVRRYSPGELSREVQILLESLFE